MDNATITLVKQVAQLYTTKHQPGRHNQLTHDPYKGQHASPGARLLELMPDVPEGANWKQKMKACDKSGLKAAYDSDPELRELVDDICGYTQGTFEPIRDAGNALARGNPEYWAQYEHSRRDDIGYAARRAYEERRADEIAAATQNQWAAEKQARREAIEGGVQFPEGYDKELDTFLAMRGGMFEFKRISGENEAVDVLNTARALRSAAALNETIRNSGTSDIPLYRGFFLRSADAKELQEKYPIGATMEIGGPTSFTGDLNIATRFAEGKKTAGGATLLQKNPKRDESWIMEIEPGARSLDINTLSPYKQHEHLTEGKFEVVGIIPGTYDWSADNPGLQPGRIVLRQKEVPVQTLPAWAERKE